jgi:FdrA protein
MITRSEIRAGAYYDSVVLMQLQRKLAALDGVDDAGVVMGTPANKELLADFDLLSPEAEGAGADDLVIIVRAQDEKRANAALGQVDELLKARRSSISAEFRPHSLKLAIEQLPDAHWVLISVPGRYAAGVAEDALDAGKHVFLYSDNVSIEDEIKLKSKGVEQGLLVMGPDCGTAIINGVGLGFANRVRRGAIGIIAASGTGLQMVSSEIHNLGAGVSQGIGTGGRDLKAEVGARTMLLALDVLKADQDTKVIVLVSKPPSAAVAANILAAARNCGKPVIVDFIGYPPPARQIGNLHFAASLEDAAALAVQAASDSSSSRVESKPRNGYLRGLFSGGTLAYEAMLGLQTVLSPLYSNVPIQKEQSLTDPLNSQAHTIVDLGEDMFTQGRLHPMMDNDLRLRRLKEEAADPETGIILLDIVLGEGAHPDPAGELAPALAEALKGRKDLEALVLVVGTDEDPQGRAAQVEAFEKAGATVFTHMRALIEHIAARLGSPPPTGGAAPDPSHFSGGLAAINIGVETFFHSLKEQEARVVQVDWRPPAGGDQKLMDILAQLKQKP